MKRRILSFLLAAAMLIGMLPMQAIATETEGIEAPETIAVTGVTLDQSAIALDVGSTATLTATIIPEDASDKTIAWTTSNEAVATAADGVITAVAPGEAVITAAAGEFKAECVVTVKAVSAAVTGISMDKETAAEVSESVPVAETSAEMESLDTSNLDFGVENPAGYVTVSFTDNGVRPEGANILDEELYGTAVGTIIGETEVPYVTGDSVADVTVRLLDAMELEYSSTGSAEDGFYLSSLNNFELNGQHYPTFGEFNAGSQSGWCVRVNNWHINQGSSAVNVEDGDVVSWLYTCQFGADIGADFSTKSAEITDVVFTDASLELKYDEENEQYTCEVPASTSSVAFEVMLENYASVVTVTVDGAEAKYRPNKTISVTSASTIVISSELEYMDADNNNEVTTYTDSVTIQLTEKPANRAPTVSVNAPSNLSATVGEEITVVLSGLFEDADGDTLTYHVKCEALDIDQDVSGSVFSGTIPTAGTYEVMVTAGDGEYSVSHTVTLTVVEAANNAPVVAENAPTTMEAFVEEEITVDLSAFFTDADNDALTYNVKIAAINVNQTLEGSVFTGSIPTAGTYDVVLTANDGSESTKHTVTLTVTEKVNTPPTIKAAYAETKSDTYIYGSSYVYIYMDDIFEDADGDTLTYKATLNGEEVEVTYNTWSKEYYIQFATKPVVYEYKIVANDGQADSEVFTAKCIGTSAAIAAVEDAPLIPGGTYLYYVMGTAENDTFALEYTLDVDEKIVTEWISSNPSVLTSNGDGTFTVGEVTSRQELYVGVTAGKDQWNSPLYLGTKNISILPAMPQIADITAPLAEHADNQTATVVSNALTGWYSNEFTYEIEDPSVCDIATNGTYGLSITPKALGSTTVTATFKYDESIKCTFTVTVTGRSLQIKGQPDSDDVTFEEGKTVQLEVLGAAEGETFTWASADESVATVDENGMVTVKKLGQTYITAVSSLSTEETAVQASMYLQIKESGKVYLDDLAVTDYSYFDGFISAKSGFNSAQLTYDWNLNESRYTYNKLAFTPFFDDENLDAVLHYQVSGGEYQTMELVSGTAVNVTNGLNPGENVVKIDVYPADDEENITTYTFHIFRPYNPSNTISRMTIYPNGEATLAYPTYLDNKEGTIFQWDAANNDFVAGWNGKPATGWSSSKDTFKTFIFGSRTSTISVCPTFAYVGQRVMIYVDGEEMEEAVTNWKSKTIPVDADGTVITFHVNSEKYHAEQLAADVEDPFAEPEKIYTLYVESVEPLGIDSKILSAELSGGEFYKPGFKSDGYTISALLPAGESNTELTFTVPAGIDVYKGTVSDANKLTAAEMDEDGDPVYTTTLTITGTAANAYSTTNIILQVADTDGNIGKTQYAFTLYRRGEKNVYPDSIVDYLCIGSQYTNAGSYGTMPERTLKSGGGTLSLGNFGGYIVYKYDTPIENNPNNPYGVDFVIYGNSFGNGGHEPGYVQVSKDGSTWYTLAGSEHYEDHNDWGFSMTYANNNGKSAWTNSDGESGEIYSYPMASAYPYFTWTESNQQSMTVSGPRLNSSAKDAYGSAAAVLPTFGYVDVNTNGTINGNAVNPYDHPGALASGGDQFDLDWAVDANGMPVELDSISYIRIATASSIYAGAIGEKSTEVTAVTRVTNAAESAVGVTAAPTGIVINGNWITVPANGGTLEVTAPQTTAAVGEEAAAALTVKVIASEGSNIYIGNSGSTGSAERSYTSIPEKGIIRIIVQEGQKEPVIYLLKLTDEDTTADPVDVSMTVSNKGTLALVNAAVTVKDSNGDGILTYHEALEAAHTAYCQGGYTVSETDYGISISEIWGVETYNSLFFRNGEALADHVGNTETSTVAEGDYLVVSVDKDDTYYSDRYSSFNAAAKNVVKGKEFTLTLKADLSTGSTAVPNATIGTWSGGVFTPLEGKITNDKGQVTLSFAETGTYIISANGTVSDTVQDWSNGGAEVTADCPLIAPVCVVTVVEAPRLADLRVSKVWADSGDYYEMTPAFDPYVTEYTVHVPDYTSSIFPYVTQAETNVGTRTAYYCCVRGFGMFGWTTSNNISLSSNTYFGAVIYGTSSTSMSDEDIRYTVNISKYATLKSLDVDGTAIIDFDRGINDGAHYYVDGTAEGVKMTPTAHNAAYTVTINGTSVTSGSEYTLPYTWDENGQMEVSITVSGTSVEENTYTLVLEKMPLNDAPFIMKEGTEADYTVIDDASTVEALFVTASANGELAYQWYYNTTESNENGILIEGATESTYTPPITEDVIGTRYYYCVVTNTGKTEGNTTASTATRITVDPDPTPVAVITNPGSELTGFAWDTGYVYNVGDTSTTLNVTASSKAEGGELSYRWFVLDKAYNGGRTYINSEDAYAAGYAPSTEVSAANTDGKYYGCQVTYAFKGKNYTSWATTGKTVTEGEGEDTKTYDVTGVYVFIKVNKAEVPEITKQPVSATYLVGKSMKNLSVTASRADGGTLTYQWYVNDTNSTEGGIAIEGATTTSYKLGTATEDGTKYYYCVVTNTIQGYTSSVSSEVAEITVQTAQDVIGEKLSGSGTEEDPFLIADAQDYQYVYDFVAGGQNFEGLYLKQTGENITLPENWTPIGTSKTKFSGTLDGNGKTVTVPEGGLPLFGYVNGAAVKNLNIYGKKIAGYGLVNNLEGVGMSGEAICIDNVTLKSGSSTLKSGLIGTYITSNMYAGCSATYYVTIKNCTIEEGVVIGYNKDQSMIGSFAGRVHGTIENCVSYATVYGKDYVGGIVGTQDNALGGTVITDSQFHGKVEATGQHAGGIAGGGYSHSSGPNGNKININDCTVTGTITGADKVGGIIGGDTYVAQLWGGHTLKNNSFTGTVKATSGTYVGGIIGFYDSLNKYDNISGNYYKAGCGAAKGIGFVQYVDTNSQTHETQSGAVYFNTGDGTEECPTVAGCGWKAGHNRTDDPLGADAAKLCYTDSTPVTATELKISGTYKTTYTTGDKLDLTGIVLTVVYNDKSEKTINLSDTTVTGYDANKVGEQELTISYNGLAAAITVKVENPKGEIKVTVAVYGDSKHGAGGTVHTLSGGNLTTWVSATTYTVDSNSTVWDVLQKVFADNGITCNAGSNNSQGTVYISSLTWGGITLAELDNGPNSGWMYTLNGNHSDNGVAQQYLKDGDKIVFHYTDDYTKEDNRAVEEVEKLISDIGTVTLESEDAIKAARKAYDALTESQKENVENYDVLTAAERNLAELKTSEADKKAAAEAVALIDDIGTVTLDSEEAITAAREAYDALTDAQKALVTNYETLVDAEEILELLKRPASDIENIYKTTGDYLVGLSTPTVGSINGEWRVIGLARSGREVPAGYYDRVVEYVNANINDKEQLHGYKSTENSRVILALTAMGKDVTDVGGHNLLEGLTDMQYVTYQGINGAIFALLAFDCHNYTIPAGEVTRDKLIAEILNAQLSDGGWALSGTTSDPDMTGMALQALAPYYGGNASVTAAVDEALSWLSKIQRADGSFGGTDGVSAESLAQVITALAALGINPENDTRFLKNGISHVDALAEFYVEGGGFKHILSGNPDMMATEQSYYALASYFRLLKGKTSLYDMTDVKLEAQAVSEVEKLIDAIGTPITSDSKDAIEAARSAYDELTDSQKKLVENYDALKKAESEYAELVKTADDEAAAKAVEGKIAAIGTPVTLESETAIKAARDAYEMLTATQKPLVGNLDVLEAAEAALKQRKDEIKANEVEALINAIGNNITLNSESAITKARSAYNALTASQREMVENYQVLVNAEAKLKELKSTISVSFTLLGCYKHGSGETSVHTLSGGNLSTWISKTTYKVAPGATVKDVLEKALSAAGMSWSNPTGNYVESINGIGEFTNGKYSGWMYTLNGSHPNLGVSQQTVINGDSIVFHYTDDYTKEDSSQGYKNYSDEEAANAVEKLIDDIEDEITLYDETKIIAAREAYEKLTEKQKELVENYNKLVEAEKALAELKNSVSEDIYKTTGDYLENLGTPGVGTVGGEWMVIGLARSGRKVSDDYYDNVVKHVQENINEFEQLHTNKSTDNSRLILALTAIGKDVADVDGHNLLMGLTDMDYVCKQGINGPIWALIAFDSGNYPIPEGNVTREKLIETILAAQLDDGGWALSGVNADPDMTGMAVQALAPYCQTNVKVKNAVDDAVWALSEMQNDNGSYSSVDGASSESIAQVIVALAALGIDPDTDARFIKNGVSAFDALLTYYVEGGGFKHILSGKLDGMATEQAYYALTAYYRMLENKTNLYDMTDVIDMGGDTEAEPTETTLPAEMEEPEEEEISGGFPWLMIVIMLVAGAAIGVLVPIAKKKLFAK